MTASPVPQPSLQPGEIVYVSWGGTGRAAALRRAMARAHDTGRRLLYLAILDDSSFGDVDRSMLELARHELSWLLAAQLELTKHQAHVEDVPVRVVVRAGDVVEQILDVVGGEVDIEGDIEVLIGAPVPASGHESVCDLISAVSRRLGVPVSLVES